MADDIENRLGDACRCFGKQQCVACEAAAEIERLRTALEVAANHMSMTGAPQTTIDAIRNAVRGG
jgi:hypothetical protein